MFRNSLTRCPNFRGKDLRICVYSKTSPKRPFNQKNKIGFQDQLLLNAGQTYCKMLQGEHSAILLTFIKLTFVIKLFVLSTFERSLNTGFTVYGLSTCNNLPGQLEAFYDLVYVDLSVSFLPKTLYILHSFV